MTIYFPDKITMPNIMETKKAEIIPKIDFNQIPEYTFEDDKKDIPELPSVPSPMTDEELKKYYESETETVTPPEPEADVNDDYVVIYETTEEPDLYIIILAALGTAYAVYKNISMDKTEDDSFSDYKVNSMDEIEDYSFDPEYEDSYQTEEEQTKRRWL